jgi:transcriptional regulator with XRE-family HTH domain
MTIGQKIRESRRKKGKTLADVAGHLGFTSVSVSDIERDRLKDGPSAAVVVKISQFLDDTSIMLHYLETNPVYQAVIPRIFPDLNNIRKDPAIIFSRFADEAGEAMEAARILSQIFANADPKNTPNFLAVFAANMEQIIDVQRCAEILILQLIEAGVMSDHDRADLHERQQNKCIERGHHKPQPVEA